jgi:hypothetical protein
MRAGLTRANSGSAAARRPRRLHEPTFGRMSLTLAQLYHELFHSPNVGDACTWRGNADRPRRAHQCSPNCAPARRGSIAERCGGARTTSKRLRSPATALTTAHPIERARRTEPSASAPASSRNGPERALPYQSQDNDRPSSGATMHDPKIAPTNNEAVRADPRAGRASPAPHPDMTTGRPPCGRALHPATPPMNSSARCRSSLNTNSKAANPDSESTRPHSPRRQIRQKG